MPPLILFDLDQTLAESKQALSPHMADLFRHLLQKTKIAIISGGALPQFLKQVVDQLSPNTKLSNLYLLPTSGGALYTWIHGRWCNVYEEILSKKDDARIRVAIRKVLRETGLVDLSTRAYGERIEYRGSEVTFSALGQAAPIELKQAWDPDKSKRRVLQKQLAHLLPEFSVGMGGATSIDITKKGVDKAFGLERIAAYLHLSIPDLLYVGDQLEPGGNDEAVLRTPIQTRAVKNPGEAAFFISSLLKS